MFIDRQDAGQRLAIALQHYTKQGALVLATPRGGVIVGCQVAERLVAEFSIIIVRKLPFPDNPEAGFGAVAEVGSIYLIPNVPLPFPRRTINRVMTEQKKELETSQTPRRFFDKRLF